MSEQALSPQELERQGMQAYQAKELETALARFEAARLGYQAQQDELKSLEMSNNLSVVLLQLDRPEEALAAVEGSAEIFERREQPERAAQAYGNLASALEGCGRLDEAEAAYRQAAEAFQRLGDQDSQSHTLKALSQLQLRQGRAMEALASMQRGLDEQKGGGLRQRILRGLLNLPQKFLGR
jgi:tetratricopeptide (TPR) repeat protein